MKLVKKCMEMLLVFGLLLGLAGCAKSPEDQLKEQVELGMKYLEEGNYEEAVSAFDAAIAIDPKHADLYASRGDAYVGLIKAFSNADVDLEELDETDRTYFDNASSDYRKAMELDPSNADNYLKLADILEKIGDLDGASDVIADGADHTSGELDEKKEEIEKKKQDEEKTDTAWAEELYNALENQDFSFVMEQMQQEGFLQKCKPWVQSDWAYWEDEEGYWIKISDTKSIAVIVTWPFDGETRPRKGEGDGQSLVHYSDEFSGLRAMDIKIVPENLEYTFADMVAGYPWVQYYSTSGFSYCDGETVYSADGSVEYDYGGAEKGTIEGVYHM